MPVLVDAQGSVIAGHGRILAAERLGLTEVPVIRLDHLTPEQARAYRLADNQLTILAGWNDEILAQELHALNAAGFDLDLPGFGEDELDRLLAPLEDGGEGVADEDEVPEPPDNPVSRPGDLCVLCGDATAASDVARLLEGERPHLMASDPPYAQRRWRLRYGTHRCRPQRRPRRLARGMGFVPRRRRLRLARRRPRQVAESLKVCGFAIRAQVIWVKSRFVLSRGHYHWQHEPCFYAVRDGRKSRWQGARDQSTVWQIATNADDDAATVHGTQKPVDCLLRPILNNSARGDPVYEPFAGSGTTVMAAEKSCRRCFAMELEPGYCDVIVQRWQTGSGGRAVLDGDGRMFTEVAEDRLPRATGPASPVSGVTRLPAPISPP